MEHIVLVTGADGQLGTELRKAASASASHYIFTSHRPSVHGGTLLDINDMDTVTAVLQNCGADVVINCAAYTDMDRAEGNPEEADLLNHISVGNLAEAVRECGAVLIHISSSAVFGGESPVPYREYDETGPRGVYGISKLAGERAVADSGCNYVIIRTCSMYSGKKDSSMVRMLSRLSEGRLVEASIDEVFSPTWARDLAEAIVDIIDTGKIDMQGLYHYAGTGLCSMYDFVMEIRRLSGISCEVVPCRSEDHPARAHRPAFSALDSSLFRRAFGSDIPYWRDSLEKCIEEIRNTII